MISNCPGSQKFKTPHPEIFKCAGCREDVEIWTDEFERQCPKCGSIVRKGQGQNCLDWCKSAKECVGEDVYNRYLKSKKADKK